MYQYKAIVTRVVDGDTFDADVDLGFSIIVRHRFRLDGIDTPETWRPKTEAERAHGEQATEMVKSLIENKEVLIQSFYLGIYGRYDAKVTLSDGQDLATVLINEGMEKLADYPPDP